MTTPDSDATLRVDTDARSARRYESDSQFAPGTLVAERYRIASILGKGGMGEVYRADDIKLGQTVALKFLPSRLALDAKLLDRLHDEVRLGRQITHPNVCRIYDIGEWGSAHFVAMEYIDGEDLSRLLYRIGRLPHDKAVDITRGIAAGLAAAHAKGILHRDLKPANVLIDSHGDARITDFGLALTAGDEREELAGTPAYMAPELLDGAAATIQSDLYAPRPALVFGDDVRVLLDHTQHARGDDAVGRVARRVSVPRRHRRGAVGVPHLARRTESVASGTVG